MTTITSLEELQALDDGATIHIENGRSFTKRDDKWWIGDGSYDPALFRFDMEGSRVRLGEPFERYQWWLSHGYVYNYVVARHEDEFWIAQYGGTGAVENIITQAAPDPQTWERLEGDAIPEWAEVAARSARYIVNHEQRVTAYRQQVATRDATNAAFRQEVEGRIHEYMSDEGLDCEDEIASVLRDLGLSLPTSEVDVTIEVEGVTSVTIEGDDVDGWIPEGAVGHTSEVSARWSLTVSHTVEVEGGGCGCEEVNYGTVRNLLNEEGVDYDDFEYEVSCDND